MPTVLSRSILTIIVLLGCVACARQSVRCRPEGVPLAAAYVSGGKIGGWWQECTPGTGSQGPHCRIWNERGLLLWDEEFLPYDGGSLPVPRELSIESNGWLAGPDRVCLENRRVLFPRSKFGELKRWLDGLENMKSQRP